MQYKLLHYSLDNYFDIFQTKCSCVKGPVNCGSVLGKSIVSRNSFHGAESPLADVIVRVIPSVSVNPIHTHSHSREFFFKLLLNAVFSSRRER